LKGEREGVVIAAHGRHYAVRLDSDGQLLHCCARGKRSQLACGDCVGVDITAQGQGIICHVAARSALLYRSDAFRQKLIAANVRQVLMVVATEPGFNAELISRCLVAAESQNLRIAIVLNKVDLAARLTNAHAQLAPLQRAGYPVIELSAKRSAAPLDAWVRGQRSILVGQSGMGKSTLINALVPNAGAATREISAALDSGKHTTTLSRLYRLNDDTQLIDSPGLQVFGLAHLARSDVEHAFVEFRPYFGQCRFRDCRHRAEPDCALIAAVADGKIDVQRFRHFQAICAELPQQPVVFS
jgi:ribosome biogenesis GTPase